MTDYQAFACGNDCHLNRYTISAARTRLGQKRWGVQNNHMAKNLSRLCVDDPPQDHGDPGAMVHERQQAIRRGTVVTSGGLGEVMVVIAHHRPAVRSSAGVLPESDHP